MKHTFPFISAHFRGLSSRRSRRPTFSRGFTLVEMMVVVVIIALSAAIAMPGIASRMKSNRTKMAAEKVAIVYRTARARSFGRNSAMLVRFEDGLISIREGIQGGADGCQNIPESSCLNPATRWDDNTRSRLIETVDFSASVDFEVDAVAPDAAATPSTDIDICFTPSGRAYTRAANLTAANLLVPMTRPMRINIDRYDDAGFARAVLISPNGSARVVAVP